jgi:DNA-binding NtrC family response regulator
MVGEHLEQAAALERVLETPARSVAELGEVVRSVIGCCERLLLWGDAIQALALISRVPTQDLVEERQLLLSLELVRLKALVQLQRDREALDLVHTLLNQRESFPRSAEPELFMVRVLEGQALWHLNRTREALSKLEHLRTELLPSSNLPAGAACSAALASSLIMEGKWLEGRKYALEAWVLARRAGEISYEGISQNLLCIADRGLCRWENSHEAASMAIQAFESIGAGLRVAFVRRALAITQWKRGELIGASDLIRAAVPVFQNGAHTKHVAYAHMLESLVHLHAGRISQAAELLARLPALDEKLSESRPELLRLEYLGDIELEQGHAEAALKRYDEVLPHALALIPRGDVVAELRRRRAECYMLLGRAKEAHEEAKAALELCLELGDRYEEAATYRTIALAAAALGRQDEAKKHFVHGFAMYDDIETPYEWGKLWMSYGDWLCGPHAGSYESLAGAAEAYKAACDHLEHMGAELKLAQARERAKQLDQRRREEGIDEPATTEKPRPRRRPSLDRELQRRVQWAHDTFALVTRHRPLLEMLEQIATVAVSDIPVLVLGDSGTGKELIARGVHAVSGRTGSLVEVNCSAVPATMMEAEFFGSIHGSYTGSTRDRAGLFEEAHEGSVFLDEIGDMPVDLQSKLLRFLETGEVRRIGANTGRRVDARLIAATNRDSTKLQAGEVFRQDLYYRLAHAVFTLPPLRTRGDDVALLVDHFLDVFTQEARKRVTLSGAARERLVGYSWPGNVRQLRALIQRLVVQTADGQVITPRDIPLAEAAEAPRNFVEEMEGQEKVRIVEALEKTRFIKADAARLLRMSRTTLLGKMKRYGIPG